MKLCILGGTGFIGRHLCEDLARRGLPATVISRNPDHAFLAATSPDLAGLELGTGEAARALAGCDALVHLASASLPGINWNEPAAELVRCGLHEVQFLESFTRANPRARIIYASSGGQIYGTGHARPITEAALPAPRTAYALGKSVVEATLNLLSAASGNPVTILRLANPVGRWQLGRRHGFVSTVVGAARSGRPVTIFGQGRNERDYFDADDLAALLVGLALAPGTKPGVFNVGSGIGLTELDVVSTVSRVVGRPVRVQNEATRPFDLPYAVLSSDRARRELGWAPATPLDATIMKVDAAYGPVR